MAEHFDANQLALRAFDLFLLDYVVDFTHLLQVEFTSQHHHIGKTSIEFQRLSITDIELGRKMHFLTYLVTIRHHCYIGCNHRTDACFLGRIDNGTHQFHIFIIDNRIDSEITLDTMFITNLSDFTQIVNGKRAGRTGTHVQTFNTEIDRIGTCLDSGRQRLTRADRSHDFEVFDVIHIRFIGYFVQR